MSVLYWIFGVYFIMSCTGNLLAATGDFDPQKRPPTTASYVLSAIVQAIVAYLFIKAGGAR